MKTTTFNLSLLLSMLLIADASWSQVKIGDNPTQIVTGAKLQIDGNNTTSTNAKLIVTSDGNVGIGTASPGTRLDINGAITSRETEVVVSSNSATIPLNTSMVRLTGLATNVISLSAPAAPNPGQRLVIYNNTTGGYGSVLNSFSVPNGSALEFIYSNSGWRSINTISAPSILPYASSSPVTLTTLIDGTASTGAILGFGNSFSGISLTAGSINITGGAGINLNFGFTAPRSGTIRSISAFFSAAVGVALGSTTVQIKAQLYQSNAINSNLFSPVAGAEVTLTPSMSGLISIGDSFTGIANGLSIPVTTQSRYLLVFSSSATGISLATSVVGYASGGISIE